jgi:hypothetical protein
MILHVFPLKVTLPVLKLHVTPVGVASFCSKHAVITEVICSIGIVNICLSVVQTVYVGVLSNHGFWYHYSIVLFYSSVVTTKYVTCSSLRYVPKYEGYYELIFGLLCL